MDSLPPEEERQDPDSLLNRPMGEFMGIPLSTQDFAAWDFVHRDCELVFQPLFHVCPSKSRVPEYRGMLITCHKHRENFMKDC